MEQEHNENEKDTQQLLDEAMKARDEYLAGWQRARADLLNHKKEEMERIGGLIGYAKEEFLLKLLPVLDNLELAEKQASSQDKEHQLIQGCLQVISQFKEFLKGQGVEAIQAVDQKFNPEFHEAFKEEVAEGKESGTVLEELERGYLFMGKLLRPAKVVIAK